MSILRVSVWTVSVWTVSVWVHGLELYEAIVQPAATVANFERRKGRVHKGARYLFGVQTHHDP